MPEVHVVHTGFVFNKHCEDGTLVLKHSSWYIIWNVEMWLVLLLF